MELAHLGEARAGSKCGRMDQCCALGANHVAAMFFDGDDVQIYEVWYAGSRRKQEATAVNVDRHSSRSVVCAETSLYKGPRGSRHAL